MSDSEETFSDPKKRKGDDYGIFQRSKKVTRTPTKMEKENTESGVMEICKQMLGEIKQLRKDQVQMKEKIEINNKEVKALREEIKMTNKKWEEKYKGVEERLLKLEKKLENIEKEKRKNNIVITGLEIKKEDTEAVKQVEKWMEQEMGITRKIKEVKNISQNKSVVVMESFEAKLEVFKCKSRLRGKKLYIDSDLMPQERQIQKKIRIAAKKLR